MSFVRKLWDKFGWQAVKFCLVGGIGFAVGTSILYVMTEYGHVWYIYSNWAGTLIGQVVSFLGYKYWAFVVRTTRAMYSTWLQFVIHWAVWGVGLVIATGILYSLTTYLHVWYMFSSVVATIVSSTSNFLSHKYFTYRQDPSSVQQVEVIIRRLNDKEMQREIN